MQEGTIPTIIISIILAVVLGLVIRRLWKQHKNGTTSCGCGCGSCSCGCGMSDPKVGSKKK